MHVFSNQHWPQTWPQMQVNTPFIHIYSTAISSFILIFETFLGPMLPSSSHSATAHLGLPEQLVPGIAANNRGKTAPAPAVLPGWRKGNLMFLFRWPIFWNYRKTTVHDMKNILFFGLCISVCLNISGEHFAPFAFLIFLVTTGSSDGGKCLDQRTVHETPWCP